MANKKSALSEAKSLLSSIGNKAKSVVSNFQQDYNNFKTNTTTKANEAKNNFTKFTSDAGRAIKMVPSAAMQTLPTTASSLGNTMRQGGEGLARLASKLPSFNIGINTPTLGIGARTTPIKVSPEAIVRTLSNAAANTAQGVGSGATDLIQSSIGWYKNPWDLKNYAQSIRGAGKIAFQGMTPTTIANLVASSSDEGVAPRIAAGFLRGGSSEQLAPNVQEKNLKLGPVEFDPAVTGGQLFGFIQNPVNKKLFELTNTYLPGSGKNIKSWLMTTGIRGGIENIILSLPDMPDASPEEKAKYLAENFGVGAATEIAAQGTIKGVSKVASKEFLGKVFDELSQLKSKMFTKIREPKVNLQDINIKPVEEFKAPETSTAKDIGITDPSEAAATNDLAETGKELGIIRNQLKSETDPGIRETLKNEEAFLKQQYAKAKATASGEGFTETGEAAMANAPETGRVKFRKTKGQEANDSIIQGFKDWVNTRRASKIEGFIKGEEFKNLDEEGIGAITRFQSGVKTGLENVQKYFDAKFAELKKAGVDMGFESNYLPQLWDNTDEEIKAVFNKKLSTHPSFTVSKVISSYQEGIEAGLKPRFTKISDLVQWYESTANRAMADKKFFSALTGEKFILPKGQAPAGWVTLDSDHFPQIVSKPKGGKSGYTGDYQASPELAKLINNYLKQPTFAELEKLATYVSSAKNRMLSFGLINPIRGAWAKLRGKSFSEGAATGLNAHGFNILARSYLEGGLLGATKTAWWMVNPQSAGKAVDKLLTTAPDAVKHGLTFSVNERPSELLGDESFRTWFGEGWNNLYEKPLFEQIIPAKKLEAYGKLWRDYAKKMPEEEAKRAAANIANTIYGGKNLDEIGRSKDLQNTFKLFILAPDWMESNIGMGKGIISSLLHPTNPLGKAYRKAAAHLVGGYIGLSLVNKMTSGHYMHENDTGHTFEIEAGYTEEGQKRYVRPFGTAVDFVRLPVDIAIGLIQGDASVATRTIRNRLSGVASPVVSLLTNTNWKGQKILGKDTYGSPIPVGQQIGGVFNELSSIAGMPAFMKEAIDYGTGKQDLEPFLTQGFELPFRYSGGAYSKTQKELTQVAKEAGYSGKDLYDLNKSASGEQFSENQMGLIKQSASPIETMKGLLKIREDKAAAKKASENGTATGAVDDGEKYYVVDGDSVKAIDKVWEPPKLELSGEPELDKKLKSKYKSAITSRVNDLVTLYENGMISKEEASAEIKKLQGVYDAVSGGAKAKKIVGKLPESKVAKIKVTTVTPKTKAIKVAPGIKIAKLPTSLKSEYQQTYKPGKIKVGGTSNMIRAGMPTTLGGVGRA